MSEITAVTIKSDALSALQDWIDKRNHLLSLAEKVTEVTNQEQLDASASIQTALTKHIKLLAKERKDVTAPIDAIKKQIMDSEKAMGAPASMQLSRIKGLNDSYATKLAAEAEAERRRQAEEAERRAMEEMKRQEALAAADSDDNPFGPPVPVADPEPEPMPVVPVPQAPRTSGGRIVKRWSHTVTAPSLVPRQYLVVNDKAIRAYIKMCEQQGIDPEIPGVQFSATASVESAGRM